MEYNHLQCLSLGAQRNRLILLHHFSELFCASLALFDLQPKMQEAIGYGTLVALDTLRGVLLPSGKVRKCVSPSTRVRSGTPSHTHIHARALHPVKYDGTTLK